MKISKFALLTLVAVLLLPGIAKALCPSITITIPDIPSACRGEMIEVMPKLEEIEGDCNGLTIYPYKRWNWAVRGIGANPMASNGIPARFTADRGGHGTITFNLICRSRACPDCNRNFEVENEFDVVHVDIARSNLMVRWNETAASLSVTEKSYAPNGFVWTSRPHGIQGNGDSIGFNPSQLTPRAYTVRAANDGFPSCPDECEVHVIKVNIEPTNLFVCAEDAQASLNLSSDSYSPGGYIWSSTPEGISGSGTTITFVPSNLPPGQYVVHSQSVDLSECYDKCEVNICMVDLDIDSNNDWVIDANDDLVETDSPGFKFWINDRNSYESIPNTYWESGFGGSSGDDNGDSAINGVRDLEDFASFRLELAKDLSLPSGYRYQLEIVGALEIKVFKRLGESYLTDLMEAQQQVQEQAWGVVSSAQPLVLDLNNFDADEQYFIFEGVGEGQGTLRLALRDAADQEVCADEVEIDLVDIRERYSRATTRTSFGQCQETVVSEYSPIQEAVYDPDCDCYVRQPIAWKTITYDCYQNVSFTDNHLDPVKNKVFIWMHGFAVDDDGASIWFDTMFKRLYWSKYDGDFLGISWEGNEGSIALLPTYYNQNVENAFQTAQAVADFVSTVAPGKTKDIGAHSLGNMLMLEALRILDESSSQPVRNIVNMQAAVPGDVYEAKSTSLVMQLLNSLNAWKGFFRPSIGAAQTGVLNTFSQEDEVLDGVLVLNEFIKPITGIVMFWLWNNNSQAYLHPKMEDALGLISVAGQHPGLSSTDVYINQSSSPHGIRDHSSMKDELFLDVEDYFTILRNEIQ